MRNLCIFPDPILRRVCAPVEDFGSHLVDLYIEMLGLMRAHEGIGLAAPQIGIGLRFFVAKIDESAVLIANPAIRSRSGQNSLSEGCLSLPGQHYEIARDSAIEVVGFDAQGNRTTRTVEGLWARVMQHEIDHLDGILICDYTNGNESSAERR